MQAIVIDIVYRLYLATTPPATIKVLLNTGRIVTVPFQTHVENILPNEWISSWDEDALGAAPQLCCTPVLATHFRGHLNTKQNCVGVTDDVRLPAEGHFTAAPLESGIGAHTRGHGRCVLVACQSRPIRR